MILCVGGWEDRREEGADTALKTKTPHVNVGKNHYGVSFYVKAARLQASLNAIHLFACVGPPCFRVPGAVLHGNGGSFHLVLGAPPGFCVCIVVFSC